MRLTNKDLRRIIKEELTNVLQEKGDKRQVADETIANLEFLNSLASSLRSVVLFSHPLTFDDETRKNDPDALLKPRTIEEAIETMLEHKGGTPIEAFRWIGLKRFSEAYFKAAMPLLGHLEAIMGTLPEEERWEFFQNSPENVVMKFSVPNPLDRGPSTSRVPSIEFRIFIGKDRIHHEKVVKFEGDALKNDSTLYSLIEAFQNQDQVTLWDWANQQLQGL